MAALIIKEMTSHCVVFGVLPIFLYQTMVGEWRVGLICVGS